jgi:hypothetical protein
MEIPSYPLLWKGAYSYAERYTLDDAREIVEYVSNTFCFLFGDRSCCTFFHLFGFLKTKCPSLSFSLIYVIKSLVLSSSRISLPSSPVHSELWWSLTPRFAQICAFERHKCYAGVGCAWSRSILVSLACQFCLQALNVATTHIRQLVLSLNKPLSF